VRLADGADAQLSSGAEGTASPSSLLTDKGNACALQPVSCFKRTIKSAAQLNAPSLAFVMTWKVFDCAEHNPNCIARNQTIDANPDIAGIGVGSSNIIRGDKTLTTC
jgi:hypothetical protein